MIDAILLESVADKTGFPIDMLELDMQLDVDLGIDSIKRVEILSAVQERLPVARALGPEQVGTLRTLRQIAEFLSGSPVAESVPAGELSHSNGAKAGPPAGGRGLIEAHRNGSPLPNGSEKHAGSKPVNGFDRSSVSVLQTLYPFARPLESPDGRDEIALRGGGIVWISDDGSPLARAVERRLSERGYTAMVLDPGEARPPSAGERLCGLIILAPRGGSDHALVTNAFRLMRAAGPALEDSASRGGASILTVSRLDGSFGLSGLGTTASPISGALAGLAKTAACEWPSVNCKAMDVDSAFDVPDGAARVIVEEFLKRGPLEVGLSRQGRMVVELVSQASGCRPRTDWHDSLRQETWW